MGKSATGAAAASHGKVIPFYGDKAGKQFREFSNFFRHQQPYEFHLPTCAQKDGFPTSIWCSFSEKAIMATKAAIMGDLEIFEAIAAAELPSECKRLGRGVRNFDEELWQRHLEEVAYEVVRQKFESDRSLAKILLSTGDQIIAEAAPNDTVWGIGLPASDLRCQDPTQWCGRNILGYALMRAREHLRTPEVVEEGRQRRWKKDKKEQAQQGGGYAAIPARTPPLVDYYVVLDFEATCDDKQRLQPQEIIELPMVLVDASSGSQCGEFRTYVQPVHHPRLTSFCTQLTGIEQGSVAEAPTWDEAFESAQAWLEERLKRGDGQGASCLFVTCGDWDLQQMLVRQCALSGNHVPQRFKQWLNIKNLFRLVTGMPGRDMKSMLDALDLGLVGRHHSGLDDCRNIARILAELISRGTEVTAEILSGASSRMR
mmetsp:Transcript_17745/g.31047  ORF Transcript_17745/g.31047 Transcript_17745/m.31047 type:complete len:428 (-) Transcript_17745:37-1320(-)